MTEFCCGDPNCDGCVPENVCSDCDALNSELESLRQQLAQREAEVAALREAISPFVHAFSVEFKPNNFMTIGFFHQYEVGLPDRAFKVLNKAYDNTQATAEAHDAKVREQAIRECLGIIQHEFEFYGDVYGGVEALLNKPESEGV